MKQLIEAFKTARKTEIAIIVVALCMLVLFCLNRNTTEDRFRSSEEQKMEQILSQIEGAGNVHVMLSDGEDGSFRGALITAAGAGKISVMLQLQQAVHTLTGLELDKIEVVKSGH